MPRMIFKCRYLKNASTHLSNIVEYIATREGVEKLSENARQLPATLKQQQLITAIVQELPETADLFEYGDYVQSPSQENAAEFITMAVEQNLDLLGKRKNIIGYAAGRPGVERQGAHGLFSDAGVPIVLSQVTQEVGEHEGNVWTNVVSLRREDAARLGYDNARAWQALLRSQRNKIAEEMKIQPANLRWYAAFHNESHHPHVHLIAYSIDPKEAYVTKEAINRMRSSLAREIFKQDLLHIYEEQTRERDRLKSRSAEVMRQRITELEFGECDNPVLAELLFQLAERLKRTAGKKQYGYLKAPVKALVDQIVDELAKDERVADCYAAWYELRHEVLRTYNDQLPPRMPLSQQKEFKSIKNRVIAEALTLGRYSMPTESQEDTARDESTRKVANEMQGARTESRPVGEVAGERSQAMEQRLRWKEGEGSHSSSDSSTVGLDASAAYVEQGPLPDARVSIPSDPLPHPDAASTSAVALASARLLHDLSDVFQSEYRRMDAGTDAPIDSKLRRKLRRKKMSQGHAQDDHTPRPL